MNKTFTEGIARATALTRAGNLQDATALIQSLLGRAPAGTGSAGNGNPADDDVIEGDFTQIDADGPQPPATPTRPVAQKPRTRLSETLRRIAAGGMPAHGPLSLPETPIPPGARFLSLTHTSPDGALGYRLYVPASRPGAALPLIVMLHGCTQTPEDFAAGTGMNALAEEFGCVIAYPAQPMMANAQRCWNWFRPEDQGRGRGEPAMIAGLTGDILRDHPIDASRVYIAGLSAGAATAVIVAAAYPEVFSAVGAHSGLPAGSAHDVPSAFSAMRSGSRATPHQTGVPTIVFHGSADTTVHPVNAAAIISQAIHAMPGLQCHTQTGRSEGGRRFRKTAHQNTDGRPMAELWEVEDAGHAWMGGKSHGSYTDPSGPDASRHMIRFFLHHAGT